MILGVRVRWRDERSAIVADLVRRDHLIDDAEPDSGAAGAAGRSGSRVRVSRPLGRVDDRRLGAVREAMQLVRHGHRPARAIGIDEVDLE
jgi:hypothetical protein